MNVFFVKILDKQIYIQFCINLSKKLFKMPHKKKPHLRIDKLKHEGSQIVENQNPQFPSILSENDIQKLLQAENNFKQFSSELGDIRDSKIRGDVINHCDKSKLELQTLTFEDIPRMIKNRIQKMIKNKRIKKNWSQEDVKILAWIISKYSDYQSIEHIEKELGTHDWSYLAGLIPGLDGDGCMFKWLSLRKVNLSQNRWNQRQSGLLQKVVKKYGQKDWFVVSQKLYYLNPNPNKIYRCAKQCREHWNCYLNPNLKKGPWTKEEDIHLLTLIKNNKCEKRWAQMVNEFEGRTENALKNRFTLIMEKQMKFHQKEDQVNEIQLIQEYLEKCFVQQFVESTSTKAQKNYGQRIRTRRRIKKSPEQMEQNVILKHKSQKKFANKAEESLSHDYVNSTSERKNAQITFMESFSIKTIKSDQIGDFAQKILEGKQQYYPCTFDGSEGLKRLTGF